MPRQVLIGHSVFGWTIRSLNRVRRRTEQAVDQALILVSQRVVPKPATTPFDGAARVSVVTVSFNTLRLTKLMLLTLADCWLHAQPRKLVVVDNGSTDGSREFLRRLSVSSPILHVIENRGQSSHAHGLRCGIRHIESIEREISVTQRTNVFLIVDSDVIFLSSDLFPRIIEVLIRQDAALVGQLQYDVGEPYAHPCCMLLRRDCYGDKRVLPFVNHGAPALWLQRSMRKAGMKIVDFPVLEESFIVHRGRGTIDAIPSHARFHSCATAPYHGAHYHGNANGEQLWYATESRFDALLKPACEEDAIRFINSRLLAVNPDGAPVSFQ